MKIHLNQRLRERLRLSNYSGLCKVFCNSIGWVKSARALNSWMTSVLYAHNCAPKYCIDLAWDSQYIKSKIAQIPMTVFAKL